ncbi:hypothetical protein VTJ83DRAFT_7312 [Remersonia thermophila]|uniref:Extracellular membrane protein CFEM domain-containing protein n=1 Tax=Remersonia thermophila TaxID=72144 RepID=A0ABR4D358_9PEZI
MLPGRMPLLRLGIWTTLFAAAATAQTTNVSSEILNFVPSCAQKCFRSFISANFDAGICGNSPSFQCLCRQRGSSGYTLGEGAASCVSGEAQFGACRGEDGIESAKKTAYHMCINVSNAQPQTHTAIAATLIQTETGPLLLPTSISMTTPTRTAQTPGLTATTPTVVLPTGTPSTTSFPAGFTPISSVTGSGTTRTLRPIATTNPDDAPDPPKFTTAEITGIALGSAAALALGILLIILARRLRKRRFRDLEANGFFKMPDSMSPGGKKKKSKKKQEGTENSPDVMEISAPLPEPKTSHDPLYPHWQPQIPAQAVVGLGLPPTAARGGVMVRPLPTTASPPATASPVRSAKAAPRVKEIIIPPAAAAVATTSAAAPAAQTRPQGSAPRNPPPRVIVSSPTEPQPTRMAGNSPPRPALTLAIPKQQTTIIRPPAPAVRDSVVTEFAEDGEGDQTSASTSVWRPPPSDPQSATTLYFADKNGNWILRNTSAPNHAAGPAGDASGKAALGATPSRPAVQDARSSPIELPSPEHKTRAERAREAYGGFSPDAVVSPLRLPRKPEQQGRLGSPIAFRDQQQRRGQAQHSSPSLASSTPEMAQRSRQAKMKSPSADVYFAVSPEERDSRAGQKRDVGRRPSARFSQGSATSIEDAADDDDAAAQMDLSPVVESPQTPISPGKSPVTYPKIRKRNNDEQPFGWNAGQGGDGYSMPRPRAVTPFAPQQQQQTGPRRPRDGVPNLRPQAHRNPSQPRTGSPETRAGSVPPLEEQYLQRQRQIGNPASYWNHQQSSPPPPPPQQQRKQQQQVAVQPPPPTPPYELPADIPALPTGGNRRYNTPPQQYHPYLHQHAPGRPAYLPTPADTPQSRIERPPAQPLATQEFPSAAVSTPTTASSTTSSQGSLLAKRLGADKAAALALTTPAAAGKSGKSNKWKKEVVEEPAAAEASRRQGQPGGSQGARRDMQQQQQQQQQQQERDEFEARYGQVPITPGWVPELTPTRRGGDLYLNVR